MVNAARLAGNVLPAGPKPLWATEMWWFTNPPNPIGVPVQKHARWLEQALYLLWKQGARAAVNYEIRDPVHDSSQPPGTQWTTGVFFNNGTKKPAYTAWRFPFVGDRLSSTRVRVWGKAPVSGTLNIQRQDQDWMADVAAARGKVRRRVPVVDPVARQRHPAGEDRLHDEPYLAAGLTWR